MSKKAIEAGLLDKTKFDYYGFDHEYVKAHFEGNPEYVGTFCVKKEPRPRAVYWVQNPDTAKGHKNYMTLQKNDRNAYVSGMTVEEMEEYRFQSGIKCKNCKDVIYSVAHHDFRYCTCKANFIDGGREYTRIGGSDWLPVKIDLITGLYSEEISY